MLISDKFYAVNIREYLALGDDPEDLSPVPGRGSGLYIHRTGSCDRDRSGTRPEKVPAEKISTVIFQFIIKERNG